ncbi:MAG TPA: hypothetical protein VIQ56_01960 [Gaiella sp.]|jgi:hypothetical protein
MTHPWLFAIGVLVEGLSIAVFAVPDFVPGLRRFVRWLGPRARRAENRARRLLRLPGHPKVVYAQAGVAVAAGMSAKVRVSVSEGATPDEKIAYLLRREQAAQDFADRLSERVESLSTKLDTDVEALRVEFRDHVGAELRFADEEGRTRRQIGAFLLVVGVVCQAVASLL